MPKITTAQAQQLLKDLGADVEVVADEKEADKDLNLSEISEAATQGIKDLVTPDIEAELTEKLETAGTGKVMGLLRQHATKTFGIPQKDIKEKDLKDILEIIKEKSLVDDKTKDYEAEKQELINDYEAQIEALKNEKETEVSAERKKYIDRDISAYFVELASKLNRKDGDLKEHAELLETKFRKQYEIEWDETKQTPVFKQNGVPAKSGAKAFDPQVEANSIFERVGILAKDTRHITPSDVTNPKPETKQQVRTGIKQLPIASENARALHEQLSAE